MSSLLLPTVLTAVQADPAQRKDRRKSFVEYSWAREEKRELSSVTAEWAEREAGGPGGAAGMEAGWLGG